jgi:uncharacterized membrane protein YozB (DUF420 family)
MPFAVTLHTLTVALHVSAVVAAAAAAPLALRTALPLGARLAGHRVAGRVYALAWACIVVTGAVLGARRPGVSVFEVLNVLGAASVAGAVATAALSALRRRLGREWLRWHLRLMLASTAFLVVATANQALARLPGGYPGWLFYALVAAPSFVLPRVVRRLAARAGLPDRPARRRPWSRGAGRTPARGLTRAA